MLISFVEGRAVASEWLFEGRLIIEAVAGSLRIDPNTEGLESIWRLGGRRDPRNVVRWELTGDLMGLLGGPDTWDTEEGFTRSFALETDVPRGWRHLHVQMDLVYTPPEIDEQGLRRDEGVWLLSIYSIIEGDPSKSEQQGRLDVANMRDSQLPWVFDLMFEPFHAYSVVIDPGGEEGDEPDDDEEDEDDLDEEGEDLDPDGLPSAVICPECNHLFEFHHEFGCFGHPLEPHCQCTHHATALGLVRGSSEPTGAPRFERADPLEDANDDEL